VLATPRDPAHTDLEVTVDTSKSSAPAHPSTEETPHACLEGVVYIGHLVEDPGTGEEIERVEALPCRRCDEEARDR